MNDRKVVGENINEDKTLFSGVIFTPGITHHLTSINVPFNNFSPLIATMYTYTSAD
jgi:hypothetical protein